MTRTSTVRMSEVVNALVGKRCWYVSAGGAGPSFGLAFGKKLMRQQPLTNKAHSPEYRKFEGESNLLVWCSWRLDAASRPLVSSDDKTAVIREGVGRLAGARVEQVRLEKPAWDLALRFSNDLRLKLFCDHVSEAASFDGNWELWLKDRVIVVGLGSTCTTEERA
jgi:hypothetical protein